MVKRKAGSLARRRSIYAPVDVSLLGANAVVAQTDYIAYLLEQLLFAWGGRHDKLTL